MLNSERLHMINRDCLELNQVRFDLKTIFAELGVKLALRAQLKNLYLDMRISPETPRYFIGDSQAIKELIFCLVNTSLRSTINGGVSIMLRSTGMYDREERLRLEIEVSDTGAGLTPEVVKSLDWVGDKAGEIFSHDECLIGLLTAKRLAKLLGGELAVQSVFGWGTRFLVSLSLEERWQNKAKNQDNDLSIINNQSGGAS